MPTVKGKAAKDLAKKLGLKQTKRHKYRAVRTVVDGLTFPSKKEAKRYSELKALEAAGEIRGLELQPTFDLYTFSGGTFVAVCKYKADFRYLDMRSKRWIVEDVKGMLTPIYRLKRKWLKLQNGIEIVEI